MTQRAGCEDPTRLFRPQWAYVTPPGYRDETYVIPINFTVLANGKIQTGLPWQLDDDVPWSLRGIMFPWIGPLDIGGSPALARIWDSRGNPLTEGLILGLGVYGNVGIQSVNAFGFPVEPEIWCEPGGVLTFDFAVQSNGFYASFLHVGAVAQLLFYSTLFGAVGNALTIQLIDPGAANIPLSVALVGGVNVQVTLQTDGAAAIISTFQQVIDIINNTAAVHAVMSAFLAVPPGSEVITALGVTALAGGVNGTNVELFGCLIGVKRFPECL